MELGKPPLCKDSMFFEGEGEAPLKVVLKSSALYIWDTLLSICR